MSTISWRGDAPAIAQVVTVTVTADDAATTYKITMGTKIVSVLGGGVTAAADALALQVALAASTIPEFMEVTWTYPGTGAVITGTAVIAGVPFTATSSVSGGAGTIGAVTTTTTSSGPNDVNTAANYSAGALPVNSDTLNLTNNSSSLLYNLQALSAVTLTALNIDSTFTGAIGLPALNSSGSFGSGGYVEYRQKYFQIGVTTFTYLPGTGGGSPRVQLDFGSVQNTSVVAAPSNTSSPFGGGQGRPAVLLKGSHASNVLTVTQGRVGSAIDSGEVSTWATVNVGYQRQIQTDVTLTFGSGVTIGNINQDGGTLFVNSAVTTWTQQAGTATVYGTATATTLTIQPPGGLFASMAWQSTGTITTLVVNSNGTFDCSSDPRARTITNTTVYAGGTLNDPNKTVTFTNAILLPDGIAPNGGAMLSLGTNLHLQRS